jgi:HEAT repeat protein
VNADRSLLHTMVASDSNATVRRLAILCLKNGSPQRDTIVMLEGIAEDDEQDRELREAAKRIAAQLTQKARAR